MYSKTISRRQWLASAAAAMAAVPFARSAWGGQDKQDEQALICITLDLEMSRHYPTWEQTHWDYEKGNLDEPTKTYTVEACRRVKERGGRIHCFSVARVCEQEDVDWLKGIAKEGHPVGNHTYDHVNVKATRPEDIQYRFRRSPWLIAGKKPEQVIRENIELARTALRERTGITQRGFRTPGGFHTGLTEREDIQRMLLKLGFRWVSSKYPRHLNRLVEGQPPREVYDSILTAQADAQPFIYPSGLVEIPMSPISDVGAFRSGRWKLPHFMKAIRQGVEWAIEKRAVFDFLAHPSCLVATDPKFQTIEMICDLVEAAGDRAKLVDLDAVAARTRKQR